MIGIGLVRWIIFHTEVRCLDGVRVSDAYFLVVFGRVRREYDSPLAFVII